jgi:serine/threonine protein kinase
MESAEKKANPVLVDGKAYNVISVRNGGMGRVWLLEQAFEEPLDPVYKRRIAVKTFDFVSDERAVERELNIWISLRHESVRPLLKIGRLNYRLAAIMPQMVGSLDDLLESTPSVSEQEASRIIREIAIGLDYAWKSAGVLHLDLKPSNILLVNARASRVKVADWGISRLVADGTTVRTKVKLIAGHARRMTTVYSAGTPLFMCPERFREQWTLAPAADIYSLGLMAIQLNTGILPFRFGQADPLEEIVTGSFYMNTLARC